MVQAQMTQTVATSQQTLLLFIGCSLSKNQVHFYSVLQQTKMPKAWTVKENRRRTAATKKKTHRDCSASWIFRIRERFKESIYSVCLKIEMQIRSVVDLFESKFQFRIRILKIVSWLTIKRKKCSRRKCLKANISKKMLHRFHRFPLQKTLYRQSALNGCNKRFPSRFWHVVSVHF